MIDRMRSSLAGFRVLDFDHWQFESALHEGDPSAVEHTLAVLAEQGHTYTADGALWLRTTDFGDDKDRVLVRSSGEHTYFASDTAYHQDKRERGFERQVDVWGADHHGYVARTKAAYEALGGDPGELELLIMQLVHLVRSGEKAQMSKRAGEFVTLDELVEEIGVDAARWYLVNRGPDQTMEIDLDLASEKSQKNPVYYVQYAHARIAGILRNSQVSPPGGETRPVQPLAVEERDLIKRLLEFPRVVAEATERRAPQGLPNFAIRVADDFHRFYTEHRVLESEQRDFRLVLARATQRVIARSLDLIGVEAPERM
jgi:arginyl-tRNA synthetase